MARDQDQSAIAELEAIEDDPPRETAHIWRYYCELSQERPINGMALARLPRADIRQWEADECISLALWERRAILLLDTSYVASVHKTGEDEDQSEVDDEETA